MKKDKKYVDYPEAMALIRQLACSQGMWGRYLRRLEESDDLDWEFRGWLEENQFPDTLSMILALEGN